MLLFLAGSECLYRELSFSTGIRRFDLLVATSLKIRLHQLLRCLRLSVSQILQVGNHSLFRRRLRIGRILAVINRVNHIRCRVGLLEQVPQRTAGKVKQMPEEAVVLILSAHNIGCPLIGVGLLHVGDDVVDREGVVGRAIGYRIVHCAQLKCDDKDKFLYQYGVLF